MNINKEDTGDNDELTVKVTLSNRLSYRNSSESTTRGEFGTQTKEKSF